MDLDLEYAFFLAGTPVNNIKLWEFAENGLIDEEILVEDVEGNKLIWTGKSFQVCETKHNQMEKYVGLCKGDTWRYVGADK